MRKCILGMLCLLVCLSFSQLDGQYSKWDVPYVPTPYQVINEMLDIANITSTDMLYDLGCGDGRIVITAARRMETKGVGVEIDPERIKECRAHAAASNVENLVASCLTSFFAPASLSDTVRPVPFLLRIMLASLANAFSDIALSSLSFISGLYVELIISLSSLADISLSICRKW